MEFVEDNIEVGRLMCGNVSQRQPSSISWPGNRAKPTVFCHVEDAQERVMGSGYNKQQQIVNDAEVDIVVSISVSFIFLSSNL